MTIPRCGPTTGSRDTQPCRSGSYAPSRRGGGSGGGSRAAAQVDEPVGPFHELARDRREAGARVAQRHPRPLREVALVRRSVSREVPPRQLRERRVAVNRRRIAQPVPHERVRVLPPGHRPAHREAAQRREQQHVDERLPARRHVGGVEPLAQLRPRQRPLVGERPLDDLDAALGRRAARRPPARAGARSRAAAAASSARAATGSPRCGRGGACRGSAT